MPHLLRCPSLVFLAFALFTLGCSKKVASAGPAAAIETQTGTQTVTKEFVRQVSYRPVISGQIARETTIDTTLSCVQWVKLTSGNSTAEALEFHHTACPNDGTALSDDSLSFRTWLADPQAVNGGSTQTLFQIKEEQAVNVGQIMNDNNGARLEELCQFTNQTVGSAPYVNSCQITETSHSWGTLDLMPAGQLVQTSDPAPQAAPQSEEDTSSALARR